MIVADNVVRGGAVIDPDTTDANALGVQRFLAAAGADPRIDGTAVQTVGTKGHDGFALLVVRGLTPRSGGGRPDSGTNLHRKEADEALPVRAGQLGRCGRG